MGPIKRTTTKTSRARNISSSSGNHLNTTPTLATVPTLESDANANREPSLPASDAPPALSKPENDQEQEASNIDTYDMDVDDENDSSMGGTDPSHLPSFQRISVMECNTPPLALTTTKSLTDTVLMTLSDVDMDQMIANAQQEIAESRFFMKQLMANTLLQQSNLNCIMKVLLHSLDTSIFDPSDPLHNMTQEELRKEKERLQQLINEFDLAVKMQHPILVSQEQSLKGLCDLHVTKRFAVTLDQPTLHPKMGSMTKKESPHYNDEDLIPGFPFKIPDSWPRYSGESSTMTFEFFQEFIDVVVLLVCSHIPTYGHYLLKYLVMNKPFKAALSKIFQEYKGPITLSYLERTFFDTCTTQTEHEEILQNLLELGREDLETYRNFAHCISCIVQLFRIQDDNSIILSKLQLTIPFD
ncbi:hypothetical protein BG005_001817 [Podila minutissima]|nr:hypothetical protein BG005_001817 [Podila minutissima]